MVWTPSILSCNCHEGGASQNTRFSTSGEKATADAVQIPVIVLCVVNTDDTTFVWRRAVALLNPATQQTPSRCWWSCVEGRLHPATQIAPPLRQNWAIAARSHLFFLSPSCSFGESISLSHCSLRFFLLSLLHSKNESAAFFFPDLVFQVKEHGQSIHGGQCETRRHGSFT